MDFDSISSSLSGAGGKAWESVQSMFTGPDVDLDKVKKATKEELETLKKDPKMQNAPATMLANVLDDLTADLEELGIKDPAEQEKYKQEFQKQFYEKLGGSDEILRAVAMSPEKKQVDNFINDYKRFSKLDEKIKDAPSSVSLLLANLIRMWIGKKDPEKYDWFDRFAINMADKLEGKKPGKKEPEKKPEEKTAVAAAAQTPETKTEASETQIPTAITAVVETLKGKNIKIDETKLKDDFQFLSDDKGINETQITALVEDGAKAAGNLGKLYLAIKGALPGEEWKNFPYRLKDVYFQHADYAANFEKILATIKEDANAEYILRPKNKNNIRTFLDKATTNVTLADIAEYKKTTG